MNDRGPFVDTRVIDLSKATAVALDFKNKGKTTVRVQYIGRAPLNDNGSHLLAMNKELDRGTSLRKMIAAADRRKGKGPAPEVMVAEVKPPKKKTVAQPEPQYETAAYEAPADSSGPAETATDVSFFIQLGSFGNSVNAARARDRFAAVWPVQFIELSGASGPVYRVRLGPISNGEDAQTALIDAQTSGYGDARLIRNEAVQASLE